MAKDKVLEERDVFTFPEEGAPEKKAYGIVLKDNEALLFQCLNGRKGHGCVVLSTDIPENAKPVIDGRKLPFYLQFAIQAVTTAVA